ncbi:MAG TPA: ATP-binding protein [Planctomycetota bacterium]|nr:ATP-binding protein [Planctomycetota bacterium]
MRIIIKFSATLVAGLCGILVADGIYTHHREVQYFANDMRLDHLVLGDAVVAMVEKTWATQGREEALRVPRAIDQPGRHLSLGLVDPAGGPGRPALSREIRERLAARQPVVSRDGRYQHSLLPIAGPGGDELALEIREPLAEEIAFSNGSMARTAVVTAAMIALCAVLTFAIGFVWMDRPIRTLCDGARRIGGGDLDVEVQVPGNNELSLLAAELNAMSRSLAEARRTVAAETERRIEALEQLRQADRLATVGQLAAGVAHELGTPLNVVWESGKMIARGEVEGPDAVESARTIAAQAERMTTIIRQLLDFARPRAAVKEPTELVALVQQTLHFLDNMAQKRGIRLEVSTSQREASVEVDPAQMQQVLTNLVVNAIQATPAGGRVEVALAVAQRRSSERPGEPAAAWQRIDVRDTGTGIAEQHRPHLFEPFFTTKDVGEGTGLGLSVSSGIVKEHGGWIDVDSQPGAGSCFSVFLPLRPAR